MVPLLNHLVKPACFLTKSVHKEDFSVVGLKRKGSDHHLKLAHDLMSKVKSLT